jgi:hypothetical protein
MVLKAGLACTLHDGEECESTAMCVERVAADLMGLTSAVAVALKHELKSLENDEDGDDDLIKQWCQFYSEELLPDTKKFVKKTSSKLDVYGLYLPSRMSASLPQELLEKGLKLGGGDGGGQVKKDKEGEEKEDGEEEEEHSEEQEKEEVADESAEGKTDVEGDVSLAMSSSNREEEELGDEYDEEYYDEYDEED